MSVENLPVNNPNQERLGWIVHEYGVPDPRIVGKLPRSGIQLDYVGHADITRILLEIDPYWTIEPVQHDEYGLPAVRNNGKMIEAAFWLTVCGHRRYCVGSVEARKQDGDVGKELLSDAIRNGAMRFGIALSLWSKEEWGDDLKPAAKQAAPKKAVAVSLEDKISQFEKACRNAGFEPDEVADKAGVNMNELTESDFGLLRAAFKEMK